MIENIKHAKTTVFMGVAAITFLCASSTVADEGKSSDVDTLRSLVEQQQEALKAQGQRIDSLETRLEGAQQKIAPKTKEQLKQDEGEQKSQVLREPDNPYEILSDSDFPRSVPLFDSDWRFSFGGYFKTDFIVDFDGTGDPYSFVVATIPVEGAANSPQPGSYTQLHVKETRFNFEMRNVSKELPFTKAFLEMDFFDETSPGARLRHAYVQYGHLIVGQTWTTLTEMRALPFLVDFAYGDALYGNRTVQIRWEQPVSDSFSWALGIEDFNDGLIANPGAQAGTARSQLPMLAGRGTYSFDRGILTLGGSLAQLRWDGDAGVSDETALQWAGVLGSRIYLDGGKKHYLGLSGSFGDGSAPNIISLLEGNVPAAILKADGSLETLYAWNAMVSLHFKWSEKLSSNFGYAWADVEDSDLRGADEMKAGGATHINLIYDVSKPLRVGVEFMTGQRVNVNDADGRANRLQFMTMYSF